MTRPVLLAASTSALIALGACNTIEGAGQDLSIAGQSLQQESQQAQNPEPRPDIEPEPDIDPERLPEDQSV